MLYGVGKNAYEHAKEAANETVTSAGNISKGDAIHDRQRPSACP